MITVTGCAWKWQPSRAELNNTHAGEGLPKRAATVVGRMKKMHPTDFENLTYDLLFLSGIRNLKWRTPGSDGGRDLEGDFTTPDFAGDYITQKWYVECKRYAKAINWPTVHEKLSVAINHRADFLLFVTTANFSTQCRDEVDRHNGRKAGPLIRIWPFNTLEHLLSVHGQLAVKYGLRHTKEVMPVDFRTILSELNKLAQSTLGAAKIGAHAILEACCPRGLSAPPTEHLFRKVSVVFKEREPI
jgi:hypothetical protein